MLRASLVLGLLSLVVLLSALSSPAPGGAIFHLALIDEVMSGVGGDPDAQYVEIRMEAPGQNLVHDTLLSVFDEDSNPALTLLLILPEDVPNGGTNLRWIMATQTFADLPQVQQAGFTPDVIFPTGILTPKGMVCWGAPDFAPAPDEWPLDDLGTPEEEGYNFPFLYTDCVSYGGYVGPPDPIHPPATNLPPGDGTMALQRIAPPPVQTIEISPLHLDAPPDADAFELRCPTPQNNAGQMVLLGADDDADGLPNCHEGELGTNPNLVDTDQDGCADGEEAGVIPILGGQRDPTSFWDFFDVPAGAPPQRDQMVNITDIAAVVLRFGTVSDPPLTKQDALAQAVTAPPDLTSYHAAFDRGGPIPGEDLWDLLGPDGAINILDIGAAIIQFGHTCSAPP